MVDQILIVVSAEQVARFLCRGVSGGREGRGRDGLGVGRDEDFDEVAVVRLELGFGL